MSLQILPSYKIDGLKWNNRVHESENGLIYSTTQFLNGMCGRQWLGLIWNNYEYVMAVPFRKKYGIRYVYQPAFTQQLGVVGHFPPKEIIQQCIDALQVRFKYINYPFNFAQQGCLQNEVYKTRTNYTVCLHEPAATLTQRLSAHFNKSLRRLQKLDFKYMICTDFRFVIAQHRKINGAAIGSYTTKDWQALTELCKHFANEKKLIVREVVLEGELVCACLLVQDAKRIYNLVSFVNAAGKKAEANYFLYYNLMAEFSGKQLLLDLEGSDVTGIANFYLKMHPQKEQYAVMHYNNLPAIMQLFKK